MKSFYATFIDIWRFFSGHTEGKYSFKERLDLLIRARHRQRPLQIDQTSQKREFRQKIVNMANSVFRVINPLSNSYLNKFGGDHIARDQPVDPLNFLQGLAKPANPFSYTAITEKFLEDALHPCDNNIRLQEVYAFRLEFAFLVKPVKSKWVI